MHRVASNVPHPPPQNCGIFYPAISEILAISKFMFFGRVVGSLDNDQVANVCCIPNPRISPLYRSSKLLDALKVKAKAKGIPYTRYVRLVLENDVAQ